MTTFYHIIDENLQICTDFSEISLSKNQKKVIFARNRSSSPKQVDKTILAGKTICCFGKDYLFLAKITFF